MKMRKVLMTDQLDGCADILDELAMRRIANAAPGFAGYESMDVLAFDWYDVRSKDKDTTRVTIVISSTDLLVICREARAYGRMHTLLSQENENPARALYLFFAGLMKEDMEHLSLYEAEITDAEDAALEGSRADYLKKIHAYRQELLRLKRYYDQLDVIMDNLIADDNQLFQHEDERHFGVLHNRVNTLRAGVMSLRDYVTQMREAWQAQIDLEQNNLMRVFTVLTALFLPLTLIVGWYGMNFTGMQELKWEYGYPTVIALSVAVIIVLLVFFKRKKWI